MGSYGNAMMAGFICRLCSEQKQCVIHFYSNKGKELSLLEKISFLPITVDKTDSLPKTICEECIEKLMLQHHLILKIKQGVKIRQLHQEHYENGNCPEDCPLHGTDPPDNARPRVGSNGTSSDKRDHGSSK